jgi:hypothetical protein
LPVRGSVQEGVVGSMFCFDNVNRVIVIIMLLLLFLQSVAFHGAGRREVSSILVEWLNVLISTCVGRQWVRQKYMDGGFEYE